MRGKNDYQNYEQNASLLRKELAKAFDGDALLSVVGTDVEVDLEDDLDVPFVLLQGASSQKLDAIIDAAYASGYAVSLATPPADDAAPALPPLKKKASALARHDDGRPQRGGREGPLVAALAKRVGEGERFRIIFVTAHLLGLLEGRGVRRSVLSAATWPPRAVLDVEPCIGSLSMRDFREQDRRVVPGVVDHRHRRVASSSAAGAAALQTRSRGRRGPECRVSFDVRARRDRASRTPRLTRSTENVSLPSRYNTSQRKTARARHHAGPFQSHAAARRRSDGARDHQGRL